MMTSRGEGAIDTAALQILRVGLGDDARAYAPDDAPDADAGTGHGLGSPHLPGRTPGVALASVPRVAAGPRSVILDCGTSRKPSFTHVLWIAPTAEVMIGSAVMDRLALIVGRVVGVEAYAWEGRDLLHVRAPGLEWGHLLRGAQDALGEYLAAAA